MHGVTNAMKNRDRRAGSRVVVAAVTLAVLAAAGMLLGSCRRALPPTAQEPLHLELLGTWRATVGYFAASADGEPVRAGETIQTLTFTRSRWIHHQAQVPDDGTTGHARADSGTWEVAGDTVIRKRTDHDGTVTRVAKTIQWIDEVGDVLFMHSWDLDFELRGYFVRYSRVQDPLPLPLTGTWTGAITGEQGVGSSPGAPPGGDSSIVEVTLRIDAGGSLSFRVQSQDRQVIFDLTAKWTADREHYFLILTEPVAFAVSGGERIPFPGITPDSTLRMAYAPTNNSPDEIVISEVWSEAGWPLDTPVLPDAGLYRVTLRRQP